jgi:hypothetical protein
MGAVDMVIQKKKAGKRVKTRTWSWSPFSSKFPRAKAVDREKKEREVLALANLIHTKLDPPDFPLTGRKWEDERAAFEGFVDMHFPRRRFAALREALDEASRSTVTTPIHFYRAALEARQQLRSASRTMNFICEQVGLRRPPLQICEEACGKLFIARRQDQLTCSDRCSARRRIARARAERRFWADATAGKLGPLAATIAGSVAAIRAAKKVAAIKGAKK